MDTSPSVGPELLGIISYSPLKLIWQRDLFYSKIHYIQASNEAFHVGDCHSLYHMTPQKPSKGTLPVRLGQKKTTQVN